MKFLKMFSSASSSALLDMDEVDEPMDQERDADDVFTCCRLLPLSSTTTFGAAVVVVGVLFMSSVDCVIVAVDWDGDRGSLGDDVSLLRIELVFGVSPGDEDDEDDCVILLLLLV